MLNTENRAYNRLLLWEEYLRERWIVAGKPLDSLMFGLLRHQRLIKPGAADE